MNKIPYLIIFLCLTLTVYAKDGDRKGEGKRQEEKKGGPQGTFLSDIPSYPGNIILARPTDRSMTANIIVNKAAKARIIYGAEGKNEQKTDVFELKPGESREIVMDNLPADSSCHYKLVDAVSGDVFLGGAGSGSFHTCRAPKSDFTFTIQADSHLDDGCLPELYKLTMSNALACKPDFLIDLGDTFMTGKIASRDDAAKQYLAQRYYFGLIGNSVPTFLVVGNHDGEESNKRGSTDADGLAVWSLRQRKQYFSNPVPDRFYSGNTETNRNAGQLQDFFAWEWGNALFVVIEPYWYYGEKKGGNAGWNMTLGKTQYDWMAKTLRNSKAGFKFIFIHQLTGGVDRNGRGGYEAATLFEWGGRDLDGKDTFADNRPGWEKPIHKLLVETGVNAVFHGHDHFFAHQELDGITYQLVPQPAHRNSKTHQAEEYGYVKGDFLPSSGILSVTVSTNTATVAYIKSALPDMEKQGTKNAQTAFSYKLKPKGEK